MDVCDNAQVIQSLRTIIQGPYGEEKRLKMLKDFESHHRNGTRLIILSHLIKMVPLTGSLVSLRRLMLLFSGRLLELLEEMEILSKKEIAQETLQLVKQFWSLCSNQQLVVAPIQTHGQWLPVLLEIVSSLASVYIDLFIVSYRHVENKTLCSKILYSWLTFDLNQRAIKTAFLEVTCPIKKASKLLSPILSKIIASPLESNSYMDYLLHMLLLKKWSTICDQIDIEASRNIKAPPNFVSWLRGQWGNSHDYIPQDKSFKGKRVTEFILDLDDKAIESLIDMFSDCLKGESKTTDITESTTLEEERPTAGHFVMDKKGSRHSAQESEMSPQPSTSSAAMAQNEEAPGPSFILDTKGSDVVMQVSDSEDEVQFIEKSNDRKPKGQKRKHEIAEHSSILLDGLEELNYYIIPDRKSEASSSPKTKKRRLETRNKEANIVTTLKKSRRKHDSDTSHEEVEILNDEGDEHSEDDDDNDNPLGLDVIDFESLSELAENTETNTSRVSKKVPGVKRASQQNAYTRYESTLKSVHIGSEGITEENANAVELDASQVINGESDSVEIVFEASSSEKGRTNQRETKSNSPKRLILSDPVSSYFTPQRETEYIDKMRIYDLTEDSEDDFRIFDEEVSISPRFSDINFTRDCKDEHQKTSKHRRRSSDKGVLHHGRSKEKQAVSKGIERQGRGQGKETAITIVDDSVEKNSDENEHIKSDHSISESDKDISDRKSSNRLVPSNAIVIPEDNSDDEITFKENQNVDVTIPSLEEDISQQLSNIRRKVSQISEPQAHSEISRSITPSRRSTRLRTRSEGEESGSNITLPTKHQVTPGKKSGNEKVSKVTGASPSILKDWLRSPQKLPDEVSKGQTSPLKSSKNNFSVGTINGKESPKATASTEGKKENMKSPVTKTRVSGVTGSEKKKEPLTEADITTLTRIKQKNLPAQKPSSPSKKASLSPVKSIGGHQNMAYNLRAQWKSEEKKISPKVKRSFLPQETSLSCAEFQTSPNRIQEDKLSKIGTPVSTSLTMKSKKTPHSPSKLSPKPSATNRRKSLRSAGKTDKGKGTP